MGDSLTRVERMLRTHGGNTAFKLELEGTEQSRHAMIGELQHEATTESGMASATAIG